jgi:hypothetical protein
MPSRCRKRRPPENEQDVRGIEKAYKHDVLTGIHPGVSRHRLCNNWNRNEHLDRHRRNHGGHRWVDSLVVLSVATRVERFPRNSSTRIGGIVRSEGAWESNPPARLVTPHNGFEDRASHRARCAPTLRRLTWIKLYHRSRFFPRRSYAASRSESISSFANRYVVGTT